MGIVVIIHNQTQHLYHSILLKAILVYMKPIKVMRLLLGDYKVYSNKYNNIQKLYRYLYNKFYNTMK